MTRSKLFASILFLVTTIGAVLYVNPLIGRHGGVVEDVRAKQAELEAATTKRDEALAVRKEFDALPRAERERFLGAFPQGMTQQQIITELDAIARSAGLTLGSLSFSKNLNQSNPKRVSIVASINGSGNPEAVLSLVQGVEQAKRLLAIRGISFLLGKTRQDYTLTLEAYYK